MNETLRPMLVFIGFEGEVGTIVRSVNVRADKD